MVRQQEGSHQGRHRCLPWWLPLHSRLSPSDDYLINQLIFISGGLTRGKVSFGDYMMFLSPLRGLRYLSAGGFSHRASPQSEPGRVSSRTLPGTIKPWVAHGPHCPSKVASNKVCPHPDTGRTRVSARGRRCPSAGAGPGRAPSPGPGPRRIAACCGLSPVRPAPRCRLPAGQSPRRL